MNVFFTDPLFSGFYFFFVLFFLYFCLFISVKTGYPYSAFLYVRLIDGVEKEQEKDGRAFVGQLLCDRGHDKS